jgi:hypothetical protein
MSVWHDSCNGNSTVTHNGGSRNEPEKESNGMALRRILTGIGIVSLLWVTARAQAQMAFTVTVDENGNGNVVAAGVGIAPLFSILAPDPGPGGAPQALTYDLGTSTGLIATGDVLLMDPDGTIGDVIRFNDSGQQGVSAITLVFYSDNSDGSDALADVASSPSAFYTNMVTINEIGPDKMNGAVYTPTTGQPGAVTVPGFTISYHFVSDVPEPGSAALLVSMGVSGAALLRRKRGRNLSRN